jgi:hypothetical protein
MSAIAFDANEVDPKAAFDPLPAGKYVAVITESEEKPTKKGDGSYLQLAFQVIEGEHENRKVWARLNLNNPNDTAVGIARSELSSICRAVNVMQLKDSAQLHDIPLVIKVSQRKNNESGEMTNEIKGYEPKGGATAPAAKTAAPAGNSAPWKKK